MPSHSGRLLILLHAKTLPFHAGEDRLKRVVVVEDRVPWGSDGLGRLVEGLRMAGMPE
jgi:hypothetical protein